MQTAEINGRNFLVPVSRAMKIERRREAHLSKPLVLDPTSIIGFNPYPEEKNECPD